MEDIYSTSNVRCALCSKDVERRELEAHICSEHLDYFPYRCGYCCHYMTTAELVKFHATRKAHLPVKVCGHFIDYGDMMTCIIIANRQSL